MKTFATDQKMPAYRTPGHGRPHALTSDVAKEFQTISTVDGLTILSSDNDDLTTLNTSSRAALQRYLDADLNHDGRYKATEITRYLRKHHDLIEEHAELLTALVMANAQTTDAATLNDFVNTLGLTGESIARDHEAINALLSHALNDRLDPLTTPPANSSFQAMFKLYMLMDRRGEGLFYYQDIHTFLNNTFSLSSKYSDLLVEYVIDHSDYRGYATPKEFFNTLGLTCGSLALDHRAIGIRVS